MEFNDKLGVADGTELTEMPLPGGAVELPKFGGTGTSITVSVAGGLVVALLDGTGTPDEGKGLVVGGSKVIFPELSGMINEAVVVAIETMVVLAVDDIVS